MKIAQYNKIYDTLILSLYSEGNSRRLFYHIKTVDVKILDPDSEFAIASGITQDMKLLNGGEGWIKKTREAFSMGAKCRITNMHYPSKFLFVSIKDGDGHINDILKISELWTHYSCIEIPDNLFPKTINDADLISGLKIDQVKSLHDLCQKRIHMEDYLERFYEKPV